MRKKMLTLVSITAILLAGGTVFSAQKEAASAAKNDPSTKNATTSQANPRQPSHAYLGVGYQPVPKALESQLSSAFPQLAHGAGALITNVMPGSPAAKAGIKPYDIVTKVDKAALRSSDDLMKMVRRDSSGQKLTVQIVRASKAENMTVTLGERPSSALIRGQAPTGNSGETSTPGETKSSKDHASATKPNSAAGEEVELESFDALSLERTGKDHFKAEIKFRDKQGKIDTRSFQGTREEIQKDILSQKDLPKSERHQLLGSLRLPVEFELAPGSSSTPENDNGT